MTFSEFKDKFLKQKIEEYSRIPGNHQPIVSVCVQTYNHEKYIRECLDSILAQKTDFEFEILLGEDNSSDTTRKICKEYVKKQPHKIRLFLHDRRNNIKVGGLPTGLFPALYNLYSARGKFIAYCDGDDFWGDTEKLQKQVDFLENNPDYSMCFHQFRIPKPEDFNIKPKQITRDLSREELQKVALHPLILTFCFRKLEVVPLAITRVINADSFLISLLGHQGKGKYISNLKPAVYRFHQNGIYSSKRSEDRFILEINTYKTLSRYYANQPDLSRHFQKRIMDYQKMALVLYLKTFQVGSFFKSLSSLIINNFLQSKRN